jgi:polysaccharide biosynthesis transport protein
MYPGEYLQSFPEPPIRPELQFQQLTNILRRRRGMIVAMVVIGTTLALLVGLLIPPQYTAKAQVVFESQTAAQGVRKETIVQGDDQGAIQTQVTALISRTHIQRVLDSIAQDSNVRTAAPPGRSEPLGVTDALWLTLRDRLHGWIDHLIAATGLQEQSASDARPASLEQFERKLNVFQERGSHVIAIAFKSASPQEAAIAANRVAELYVKSEGEQKEASNARMQTWLDERIPTLKAEVERLDGAVHEYQTRHGLPDSNRTGVVDQQVTDLNRELAVAQSDLALRQARLANLRDRRTRGAGADALTGTADAPALAESRRQELALLQSEANIAAALGENHPKMQQVRNQLQEVRRKINQEVDRAVDSLASDVQVAASQVRTVQQRIASMRGVNTDPHLQDLERDAASKRRVYEGLRQRSEELREQRDLTSPSVAVLSLASPPERPSSPNPLLFVPPAVIVFLVCGCFLAVLRERLDGKLRSERDIQEALGIPCIGMVPRLRRIGRRRPHQTLMAQPFAPYSEAIRSVVAALGLIEPRRSPKVILISSSVPHEGKTTLAVSVAVYTALLGRRVILLDLDFRHPATLRELAGKAGRGRPYFLPQDHPDADPIQRLPGLDLDYLAVPLDSSDPMSRFATDHMSHLLHRLRESYDCVIIDSAPVLAITETRLLAAMVDKVVFVVKWGATRREVAQHALARLCSGGLLDRWRSVVAGAVITQVDLNKHARYRFGDTGQYLKEYGKDYAAREALTGPGRSSKPRLQVERVSGIETRSDSHEG